MRDLIEFSFSEIPTANLEGVSILVLVDEGFNFDPFNGLSDIENKLYQSLF